MAKLTFQPNGKTVKVRTGLTLIQAARTARVIIPQRCGGHASCLMCKIYVENGATSQPTALELRKLSEKDLSEGMRLACQTRTTDADCTIRIPEAKLKSIVAAALKRQQDEEENEWL